jgi:hypothetical protein
MATVNKTTVIDIYTGVLGLLPPKSAIDWLTSAEYAGKPLDVAANLVLDAFRDRYSANVDDANLLLSASDVDFVKAVYARIFGLTPAELAAQSEGVGYWTGWLKNPSAGADATNNYRGSLISTMLDAALDKTQHVGNPVVEKARALLANREAVSEHYLQKGGAVDDQTWSRKVIGDVTEITTSVEIAKTVINDKTTVPDVPSGPSGKGVITGTDGDDSLSGSSGNDTLYGRGGDDKLYGMFGNDTYYFARGDGKDTIHDFGLFKDKDIIQFAPGITKGDVQLTHAGKGLVLTFKEGSDQITIPDFYYEIDPATHKPVNTGLPSDLIEEIHFADGTTIDLIAVGSVIPEGVTIDL